MGLDQRIESLESVTFCPECNHHPRGQSTLKVVYPGETTPPPEHCLGCERPLFVTIRVVYDGAKGELEGTV